MTTLQAWFVLLGLIVAFIIFRVVVLWYFKLDKILDKLETILKILEKKD